MRKITKAFLIIMLSMIMCLAGMPACASEAQSDEANAVTPRLSHFSGATFSFSATEEGGYALVTYNAYEDSFAYAKVTVKVQKRFLLAFWSDVGEWTATSTDIYGIFEHTFTLNGSGTYRANITLEVTGTDGTVDTITDTIKSKY